MTQREFHILSLGAGVQSTALYLMSMQGKLSIERMCQLACVSRAGFYRWLQEPEPVEEDMDVRSTIQTIFAAPSANLRPACQIS